MTLYAIQHVPTQRFYTPNTHGQFRAGRNWRKNKAALYTDSNDAVTELTAVLENHRAGVEPLRIRSYGGYDTPRYEDSVGDGYIRGRDFRIVEI